MTRNWLRSIPIALCMSIALALTFAVPTLGEEATAANNGTTTSAGDEDSYDSTKGMDLDDYEDAEEYSIKGESMPEIYEATAACVMDDAGTILYSYNAEAEMAMASITKIMTAMVAADSGIPLDKEIAFKTAQYQDDAQLVGLAEGDKITLGGLISVTLVFSGNDTADNIGYAVSGSPEEFVKLMNDKAKAIGLEHTHFMNLHGLRQPGHYSCASDLCKMGRYAMENYPLIRETVRTRQVVMAKNGSDVTVTLGGPPNIKESDKKSNYQEIYFDSTDELMETYEGLRGIKTGRVETGYSFLGSARRDGVTLYSCILNCEDGYVRFDESEKLLDWGFDCFDDCTLADTKWAIRTANWEDGFWLKCPILATRNVKGKRLAEQDISFKTVSLKPNALVGSGESYGTSLWSQGDRPMGSVSYQTGRYHARLGAWNPIVQPLFEKVDTTL